MKEILKSKAVRIALILAVLICAGSGVLAAIGKASVLTSALRTVLTPVQTGFTAVCNSVSGFWEKMTGYSALEEENKLLHEQIEAMKDAVASAEASLLREKELEEYLGLKKENPGYSFEEAKIIGRGNRDGALFFTLNKGSVDGIDVGMPVLDGNNLVGEINEVGLNWSRVKGILQDGYSTGAILERTGAVCVAEGSYTVQGDGLGLLVYLPIDTDVSSGDRILTSGAGMLIPEGLILGEVVSVSGDSVTRELKVTFRPAVDFTSLSRVMILTGDDLHE